jgi:hypothetical protein
MFMNACSPEEPGIVALTTWVFVLEYTKRVVCASWLSMQCLLRGTSGIF